MVSGQDQAIRDLQGSPTAGFGRLTSFINDGDIHRLIFENLDIKGSCRPDDLGATQYVLNRLTLQLASFGSSLPCILTQLASFARRRFWITSQRLRQARRCMSLSMAVIGRPLASASPP